MSTGHGLSASPDAIPQLVPVFTFGLAAASVPALMLVIPVGGCGEFGRNLTAYVCAETLVLVDCGIQMPDDLSPGIDHFVCDLSALIARFGVPHAVVLTHGHEDHVGGVYHLLRTLERPIPVYGRPLALRLCHNRLRRNGVAAKLFDPRPLVPGQILHLSATLSDEQPDAPGLTILPLAVPHSIPEACSLLITGPLRPSQLVPDSSGKLELADPLPDDARTVLHTGDYKVVAETVRFEPRPRPLPPIDLLVGDSTNALSNGNSGDEQVVEDSLQAVLASHKGRVAVTLFSSHIERISHFAKSCERHGRRLCLLGRGLHDAMDAAESVGAIKLPSSLLCTPDEAALLPRHQVALLCTGTQGESVAALGKLVAALEPNTSPPFGKLRLQAGDTVVLAARAIPGNERAVSRLADRLVLHGISVVSGPLYAVSGHGYRDELRWLLETFAPKTLLPVHGGARQLAAHAEIAASLGIPALCQSNGDVISIGSRVEVIDHIACPAVAIEGSTVGEVGSETLRTRRLLCSTGIVLIASVLGQPRRLTVRAVGISDAGPKLQALCDQAARQAESVLHTHLDRTSNGSSDLYELERSIGRVVRSVFRVARGIKPTVVCLLGESPAPPSEDLLG